MTGASQFANNINFNAGSAGARRVADYRHAGQQRRGLRRASTARSTAATPPSGSPRRAPANCCLSNPNNNYTGLTNIAQGTIRVNSVATAAGQSYSALGSGNIKVQNGATLHLDNVSIGVDQNQTTNNLVGWVDLFSGCHAQGQRQRFL